MRAVAVDADVGVGRAEGARALESDASETLEAIGRQVGGALRELRKLQDGVRTEVEKVISFDDSTPPDGLNGMRPPIAVSPASVSFQPSPSGAKPRFSSHIGSNHENGT